MYANSAVFYTQSLIKVAVPTACPVSPDVETFGQLHEF